MAEVVAEAAELVAKVVVAKVVAELIADVSAQRVELSSALGAVLIEATDVVDDVVQNAGGR